MPFRRGQQRAEKVRPPFRWIVWTLALPLIGLFTLLAVSRAREAVDASGIRRAKLKPLLASVLPSKAEPSKLALPISAATDGPRIAIILDDAGFGESAIRQLDSAGVPLSFAVLPNAPRAAEFARQAHAGGFEILCHLPLEPKGEAVSPGAGAITTVMDASEISQRVRDSIDAIPHAKGVNNHMGSRATSDRRTMEHVLAAVRSKGAYFVDSRTTADSLAEKVARELDIRTAARDVFLDDDEEIAKVRLQWKRVVEVAEKKGTAIAIGHLYPSTIQVLREEIPRLKARGFRFVFASEVVN